MDSILLTVKGQLGIEQDYTGFDSDIIININNAIMSLSQLGIGPATGLVVTGIEETWADLYNGVSNIESVKQYIWLKTKLAFDPPATSFVIQAIERQITEIAWRLAAQVEPPVE